MKYLFALVLILGFMPIKAQASPICDGKCLLQTRLGAYVCKILPQTKNDTFKWQRVSYSYRHYFSSTIYFVSSENQIELFMTNDEMIDSYKIQNTCSAELFDYLDNKRYRQLEDFLNTYEK